MYVCKHVDPNPKYEKHHYQGENQEHKQARRKHFPALPCPVLSCPVLPVLVNWFPYLSIMISLDQFVHIIVFLVLYLYISIYIYLYVHAVTSLPPLSESENRKEKCSMWLIYSTLGDATSLVWYIWVQVQVQVRVRVWYFAAAGRAVYGRAQGNGR